jgi:hypothetical protein
MSTALSKDSENLLDAAGLAKRLGMSIHQVKRLRRKRRISFIRVAGERSVRFWWPQAVQDLHRFEIKAVGRTD